MYENLMYELDFQTIFDILNCTKCKFQVKNFNCHYFICMQYQINIFN